MTKERLNFLSVTLFPDFEKLWEKNGSFNPFCQFAQRKYFPGLRENLKVVLLFCLKSSFSFDFLKRTKKKLNYIFNCFVVNLLMKLKSTLSKYENNLCQYFL